MDAGWMDGWWLLCCWCGQGVPKGVMVEHRSVVNLLAFWNHELQLQPQHDRVLGREAGREGHRTACLPPLLINPRCCCCC